MVITPYTRWVAITASANELPQGITDAIYVGAAGTITVTQQGGNSVAIPAIAGAVLLVRASHVTSLGAATSVFALYF